MNTTQTDHGSTGAPGFVTTCAVSCRKLLARFTHIRNTVLEEFRQQLGAHPRMLSLAVTEAEALAYQTDFPLLVFPTLAKEKAEAVVAWNRRQQQLFRAAFTG